MIFGFILVFKFFATFFLIVLDVFIYFNIAKKQYIKIIFNLFNYIKYIHYIQNFNILIKHNFWLKKKVASTWGFEVWLGPVQASWNLKPDLLNVTQP